MVVYFVSRIALSQLHFEHHLYNYRQSAGGAVFGHERLRPFPRPRACGSAPTGRLAVLHAGRRRAVLGARHRAAAGRNVRASRRRACARRRASLLAAFAGCFAVLGGWIYYNTNVINRYVAERRSQAAIGRLREDSTASTRTCRSRRSPTSSSTSTSIRTSASSTCAATTCWKTGPTSRSPTCTYAPRPQDLKLRRRAVRAARPGQRRPACTATRIYHLKQPLQPGATMDFDFTLQYWSRGFRNTPDDTHVVDNGTFVNNTSRSRISATTRPGPARGPQRPAQVRPAGRCRACPRSTDKAARQYNLRSAATPTGSTSTTTVSTVADQIALAPGYLDKEWTERATGRRYFHYKMDEADPRLLLVPVGALRGEARHWNGVALEVYYDPQHAFNVDRMIEAMKKSLAYYTRATSRPTSSGRCASSSSPATPASPSRFANTMPFSEVDRLHRRPARPRGHRLRVLRDRPRARPPVVGAPGDRRRPAGRDHARRDAWRSTRR